ncbi:peptidase [Robertmurraya korlensis]|uniref:M14 family zinc carboxypeptidase n=1 Tax=Robertmurraya korlensis TaxID=519977 RepID=UPI00203CDD86|nr:M14 family zinc carboxypeptidase [Robertmurraya korlensis]MCM3601739.1 peptidase [Robertmurraya korlensis]
MNVQSIIDNVPDYKDFLTVDEMDESCRKLAREFPDIVTVFEAGRSRKGHPILCMKIGDGSKNALCFACPHPNEPIGAMTLEYFSRVLAENNELREGLGFTWYLIKCIDPDGVRLNENWFKGPFTVYNYSKNYYRPIGYEQVEWTFPIDYKELHFHNPLPETKTLMKLIEETQPKFMYSLHNAGFGGAYWYITHDYPELYEGLRNSSIKQGIPLNLGEPEEPFITKFSPAIFKNMTIAEAYDFIEKYSGEKPNIKNGTSSSDYAGTVTECFTLLTELPYFFDSRIEDMSESDMTRKEAILKSVEVSQAHFAHLDQILQGIRPYIQKENPFVKLVEEVIQYIREGSEAKIKWAESDPEFEKSAKMAEVFDNLYASKFYNGLYLGLTVRTCEYEIERLQLLENRDEEALNKLKEAQEIGEKFLEDYCNVLETELDYTFIPIRKLVRIQVESGLLVANYIRDNW